MSDTLNTLTATDIFKAIKEAEYRGYMKAVADRPQGHYIKGENGEWYCSNCKRIDDKYSVANFCWHCGARMFAKDINVPYKIASDQRDYDSTYEPTYNEQDGSM